MYKVHLVAPDRCHKALLEVSKEAGDIAKVVQDTRKVGNLRMVGGHKDGRNIGVQGRAESCSSSG
jgi:hypothetical protein